MHFRLQVKWILCTFGFSGIFSFSLLCFVLYQQVTGTDLLGDDGRDGVGVSFYPGIEFQQVFYVDWLLAHQLDGQRIGLIRYRRHLSAGGRFKHYISKLKIWLFIVRFVVSCRRGEARRVLMDLNVLEWSFNCFKF